MQETVPAMMGIEHGQIGRLLIKVNAPDAILSIQLTEAGSTTESLRDVIQSRGFILLSHNGLVKAFGSRHVHSVPSGLWGCVRDEIHLVGQETGVTTPLSTMSFRVYLICYQYSAGTFYLACWTGGMEGSVLMVYVLDMLPILLNELGKASGPLQWKEVS